MTLMIWVLSKWLSLASTNVQPKSFILFVSDGEGNQDTQAIAFFS
jgi:hypothetical protein